MSKTPFTDFLNKTKGKDFSEDVYEKVLAVFKPYDLSVEQIRAFLWGNGKQISDEVRKEQIAAGTPNPNPYSYGPPRPNTWPTGGAGGDPHS
ncbi:MAG TPA: hypothetical protein VGX02_00155 [Candidatus Eremiobacteraceae bacterium]|nr:hypothetical protein [Candidatus Eremiobacteraceae bacterium]